MTELAKRKSRLRFKTAAMVRGRAIVVEAEPHIVKLRESGCRMSVEVSWEAVYWLACKKAVRR